MSRRRRSFIGFVLLCFVMSTYGFLMNDDMSRPPDQVIGTAVIFAFLGSFLIRMLWDEGREEATSTEKQKRERLDSVLRDMSDEDLLRLRQRLSDGTVNDGHLEAALLGEDGELVYKGER